MITKTYSTIAKDLTQAQAWQLMSNVDNWKRWDPTVEDSKLNGDFKTGVYFYLKSKGGPKAKILLAEVKPKSYYMDLARLPLAKMTGEHFFEETPEGLKLTVTMSINGPLSFLWYRIIMKDIVNRLPEDLKTLINEAKKI